MNATELREKTVDELQTSVVDLKKEFFNLRFQGATGEIENPRRIRAVKREISRILTIITEKVAKGEVATAPAAVKKTAVKKTAVKKTVAKKTVAKSAPKKAAKKTVKKKVEKK